MNLTIPELSLVLLVGPSGCGKSTFARKHFRPTEVVSSDHFRGLVCDDEANQAASKDAFELLHQTVARRLAWKRFTVVDATNLQPDARKPFVELVRRYHYLISAIVFDFPEEVCQKQNTLRVDRTVPSRVIANHTHQMRRVHGMLEREGIRTLHVFRSPEELAGVTVRRVPLWVDRRGEHGPFDVIGDIHGCIDELLELLVRLDYRLIHQPDARGVPGVVVEPPAGRRALFVGDLGDRGPDTPAVYRVVMPMVRAGHALCVMGNHDNKLLRKLRGSDVKLSHGLALTMEQLAQEPPEFVEEVHQFLERLVTHYVLDDGKLVVAHAGLREDLQGRASGRVRSFALFGDTTGESDEFGLPVRLNWAADYRGPALVVYGHTPVAEPAWLNNTVNIDTGCVFGGRLSALRYPEGEIISVGSLKQYAESPRPFLPEPGAAPVLPGPTPGARPTSDDVLDLADVVGQNAVETRLMGRVTVAEGNRLAALEVMSRFAANPRWLVYLPPTMAPPEASQRPGLLEHPDEVFAYFRNHHVARVVCEEKHMGSRAVVIVCRDEAAARAAFGVGGEGIGAILTRTGRRFFDGGPLEQELLARLHAALGRAGWWERFRTSWVLLDAELMPWSAKAQELLKTQYASVGASSRAALAQTTALLGPLAPYSPELAALAERYQARAEAVDRFVAAYRRYCWPVASVADLKLAPFHLLATQWGLHTDRPHTWHLTELANLCLADPEVLHATASLEVDPADAASMAAAVRWWEGLTERGGEGMVVKPLDFIARGSRGLVQPAVKCRGPEYLRIIYGPEYLAAEHLDRLRRRSVSTKRGLALREFALGVEALERFVRREPLRRVHECCFSILALESEAVDPRL
jgi:protein phosphatase